MESQVKSIFLILVLIQGAHSIEEYVGKLWEVFPPASFLTGLVSENHEVGFLIINIGLFIFGMLYWLLAFRGNYIWAPLILFVWVAIEIMNGIGHPIWSLMKGSYTPGVATAPMLFIVSLLLLKRLLQYFRLKMSN
ncbi:MAG TPA: HXXEE domain-containing protein [Cyclobacteriaceae bacterium]|nr:HXXEE domain-containing protein [Cyclobacteriaceae bacterium]